MAVIYVGTSLGVDQHTELGDVVVSNQGFSVMTDFDSLFDSQAKQKYILSDAIQADDTLSGLLKEFIKKSLHNPKSCKSGLNGSTDSYYASQWRIDQKFDDQNHDLYGEIIAKYPDVKTLDMEQYAILGLAQQSFNNSVHAASISIVTDIIKTKQPSLMFKDKTDESKLDDGALAEIEDLVGYGCLKTLVNYDFQEGEPMFTVEMIKNIKANENELKGSIAE